MQIQEYRIKYMKILTGDTTPAQSDAYNISKKILKYHAQKYLPGTEGGAQGTQLGHA